MIVFQVSNDVVPVQILGQNSTGQSVILQTGYQLALVPADGTPREPLEPEWTAPAATASGFGTGMPIQGYGAGSYFIWARVTNVAPLEPAFIVDALALRLTK